jgi:tRNA (cmo5U34)-methyltransferase
MTRIDEIYKDSRSNISDFVFDENVAEIFPNMISRSVPGYEFIIKMTGEMSKKFLKDGTNCYDLGCSLGASSLSVLKNNSNKNFQMIAIDNSPSMLEKASRSLSVAEGHGSSDTSNEGFGYAQPPRFVLGDINDVEYHNASFVISNFSLQFIDLNKRFDLIKKIFNGMNIGGAFLISEKIKFEDSLEEKLQDEMHLMFKKLNGYSDLEISQKRTALENVLLKESFDTHVKRLEDIGFSEVYQWFQCFNFISILAIK